MPAWQDMSKAQYEIPIVFFLFAGRLYRVVEAHSVQVMPETGSPH